MDTCELMDHYDQLIKSHNRLQHLWESGASGMAIGNEHRTLESAFYALINNDEVVRVIDHFGSEVFIDYLNYSAGTEFRFPAGVSFVVTSRSPKSLRGGSLRYEIHNELSFLAHGSCQNDVAD